MVCKRIFLSGKVQGVSFRYHTHQRATKLNLKGFVRNLTDGRLEILACGDATAVSQLIDWAGKGPSGARVDQVEVVEVPDSHPQDDFYILR